MTTPTSLSAKARPGPLQILTPYQSTDSVQQPMTPYMSESGGSSSPQSIYNEKLEPYMDSDSEPRQTQSLSPGDLEAQAAVKESVTTTESASSQNVAAEYFVSTKVKLICLGLYFAMNSGLTIYNKAVLGSFKFPWLSTALHTGSASLGCYVLHLLGYMKSTRLGRQEHSVSIAFSFLFTINIAISNVSLAMVSVPFHQIARSTCPIATLGIYRWVYGRTYSKATYLSLIPVVSGVGLSTYGDYYFTLMGFTLTFLGVFLASVKTVATNRLMTGSLALPALEVLLRMSPLAAAQSILFAWMTGEMDEFLVFRAEGHLSQNLVVALLGNGLSAFFLNITSFQTNKLAGALTITVCANIKQCLTILVGVMSFNVEVGFMNGLGMSITLFGAGWYSKVESDQKAKKAAAPQPARS